MSAEKISEITERWSEIRPDVQCAVWWYSAIRHCQRNVDSLCPHEDLFLGEINEPDVHPERYDGAPYAHAANDIHYLLELLTATGVTERG